MWWRMTITVTGGSIAYDGDYTVQTFTSSGTLTVSGGTLSGVDYLLIAGGGKAYIWGTYRAGGGAGGVIQVGNASFPPGNYPVVIGGAMANSVFNGQTAIKGGAGGFNITSGAPGGSGGGASVAGPRHYPIRPGTGVPGQGCAGGQGGLHGYPEGSAGGGGGWGGPGQPGGSDFGQPGAGGNGILSTITGTATYYAGGGGAFTGDVYGANGLGADSYGGGGGWGTGAYTGPNPGVLILRYPSGQ